MKRKRNPHQKTKTRFYADQNSNRRFSSISHGSSSTIWGSYDAVGTSSIFETLFERKFAYLLELEKLGADVTIANPHQFLISGGKKLHGAPVAKPRYSCWSSSASHNALCRRRIGNFNIHYLDRGYEKIRRKMSALELTSHEKFARVRKALLFEILCT